MDRTIIWLASGEVPDPAERALLEIDAAIGLVRSGAAIRVRICGEAEVDGVALAGAARAQAAGLAFRLQRETSGSLTILVGPRLGQPHPGPAGPR